VVTTRPRPTDAKSRERLEQLVMVQQEGGAAFQTRETHSRPVSAQDLELSLRALATSHTVEARTLIITSEDQFVRVGLLLGNTGKTPQKIDLRFAKLQHADGLHPISRSAELAEPRPLQFEIAPGQKVERTLYFELPNSDIVPTLFLVLPEGAMGAAELKMELL
jgi:hypothetical protein